MCHAKCKTLEILRQMSIGLSYWEPVRKKYFFNFSSKICARNHSRQENMVDVEQVHAIAKKNHYSGNLLTFICSTSHILEAAALFPQNFPSVAQSPRDTLVLANPCLHGRNTQSCSTRPSFLAFWPETQGLEGNYSRVIQCLCPVDPAIKEHSRDLWPPIMRVCPLT